MVTASVNGRYRSCPCTPGPYACIASPTLKIPYQNGTLITVDELTWTHHNHLKFILYIRVHVWCCIHYEFWQTQMTCVLHYGILQNRFTSLKILCSTYSSLPLRWLLEVTFHCLYSFALSRMSHCLNHIICSILDWLISFNNMHLLFLHVFSWLHGSFILSAE